MAKKAKKADKPAAKEAGGKKLSRKERRAQKKALRKSQLAYEKQLVAEGKIPPRNKYRSNNFFWRVFALCLVFFFGMFTAVGALLGFGAFAPVKDVLWLAGIDYTNLVKEDYAAYSLLDIVRDVMGNPFDSLSSIAKYSPVIDHYLDTFDESLSALGVHLDKEKVKATPFGELGAYLRDDVLGTIVLGEALGLTANDNNRLMVAICYGEEGVDYTVDGEGNITPISDPLTVGMLSEDSKSILDRVTVEDALGVSASSNAAMRFLAYGTEGTEYEIDGDDVVMLENELTGELYSKKTLSDLTSDGATPIENARISDLITVESDTGILAAIKDWHISDLQDPYRIERLKISEVMEIGPDSSRVAQAIAQWRLADFKDPAMMDSLKLGQVIGVGPESPPILRALEETPIGELGDAVDGLRLLDILDEEDFTDNNFLKPLKLSSLTSLAENLKNLTAADLFGEDMYEYLDPEQNGGKGYKTLYEEYESAGRNDKENSAVLPVKYERGADDVVSSYFVHGGEETRLQLGFYCGSEEDGYVAVPENGVHARKISPALPEESARTEYFINGEQVLTPAYEWRAVDYEQEGLVPLPEGDGISTETAGYTVIEREGTPYTDPAGNPYYYLTTRIRFEDGAPTQTTERVAYPILQSGYGLYYTYLKYTEGAGADEFREERTDLEYALVSLSYEEDGQTVTLHKNADGKWAYNPEEGAEEQIVPVYEKEAVTDPETGEVQTPAYYYRKTETEVFRGYYAESGEISAVYPEGDESVTQRFEIVKASPEDDGPETRTEVERILDGVWFFLFGGLDEEGNFIDTSDTPALDLTDVMSGMSGTLSDTVLWKLYFHGLLTHNPFVDLATKFPEGCPVGGEKTVKNLNECTVTESITLVNALMSLGS